MNYQLLIISELAVIGMLLCSFSIGSAGWSTTESSVGNTTAKIEYQTSIWSNYSCTTHTERSSSQVASQAFIVMAILLSIVEALLSPLYMITKTEKRVHILLIVVSIGAFVNSALLVSGVYIVVSSGYGRMSISSTLAVIAALLNLIAGITTLVVCAVRHFLKKAGALHEYMAMKILAILGTDMTLVAAVIILAICRQPSWITTDTEGADAFVRCAYVGNDFGELNRVFTTIQAMVTLAMLLSIVTVILITVYHKVNDEIKSKIIRGVYISCLLGGVMLLIGLVVLGVQPVLTITYSYVAAMFSAICSLAIGGAGVIRKLPRD